MLAFCLSIGYNDKVLKVILWAGGLGMTDYAFVETTKITSKGQATIPKTIREIIGVEPGDKISFVVCNDTVQIVKASEIAKAYLPGND